MTAAYRLPIGSDLICQEMFLPEILLHSIALVHSACER